jgi:hypothetical protein
MHGQDRELAVVHHGEAPGVERQQVGMDVRAVEVIDIDEQYWFRTMGIRVGAPSEQKVEPIISDRSRERAVPGAIGACRLQART